MLWNKAWIHGLLIRVITSLLRTGGLLGLLWRCIIGGGSRVVGVGVLRLGVLVCARVLPWYAIKWHIWDLWLHVGQQLRENRFSIVNLIFIDLQLANVLGSDVYKAGTVLIEYDDQGIGIHVETCVWTHVIAQVRLVYCWLVEWNGARQVGLQHIVKVDLL